MKRTVLIVLLSVSFLAKAQEGSGPAEAPAKYTLEDKIYALSLLWSEIKYNFANIDLLEFDLDSLYRETMQRAIDTKDDLEYFAELDRFMAAMHDGHTEILRKPDSWRELFDYIPCNLTEVNRHFYFSRTREGNGLEHLINAEIIEVDGMPISEYIEQAVLPYVIGSTEQIKWYHAGIRLQQGRKHSVFRGTALSPSGERIPFEIEYNGETTRTPEDNYIGWTSLIEPRTQIITTEWLDDIAYLDIRNFGWESIIQQIDTVMSDIRQRAKGVIIDLRFNGGGMTHVGEHLAKYIVPSDTIHLFGGMVRTNQAYKRARGVSRNPEYEYADVYLNRSFDTINKNAFTVRENYITPLDCPVVVLIGKMTYSAAEDMLLGIYSVPGRPTFIGEETGGSSGAPLIVHLPHGAIARMCTIKMLYPVTYEPFVRKGITPDIEIKPGVEDYIAGRDIVKETGLEYISGIVNNLIVN